MSVYVLDKGMAEMRVCWVIGWVGVTKNGKLTGDPCFYLRRQEDRDPSPCELTLSVSCHDPGEAREKEASQCVCATCCFQLLCWLLLLFLCPCCAGNEEGSLAILLECAGSETKLESLLSALGQQTRARKKK